MLFPYPSFGIKLGSFLAQLELQGAVAAAVVGNRSEDVSRLHLLPLLDNCAGEIAIDGDITAVTHKDMTGTCKLENAGHDTIEDSTSTGSRTTDVVRAFVVELDILHARHVVDAEAAAQHVLVGDGHRQTPLVLLEGAIELE